MPAKKEVDCNIKSLSRVVMFRIILTAIVYVLFVLLGLIILAAACGAAYGFFKIFTSASDIHPRAILWAALIVAGLLVLAGTISVYMVSPLFRKHKSDGAKKVEVKRQDIPELYSIIDDIVKEVRCFSPKKVYLSENVNACVFFDTGFWSLFFPVRKNLEIGVGLLDSENKEELKSVLAHEFGHFAQNGTSVDSSIYIGENVMHDLICGDNATEKFIENWSSSNQYVWAVFGRLARAIAKLVKKSNMAMNNWTSKEYMKLTRVMEYDADAVSCSVAGSRAFISSQHKINSTGVFHAVYQRILFNYIADGNIIEDYFKGYQNIEPLLKVLMGVAFDYTTDAAEPLGYYKVKDSRVKIEEVWDTHPSTEDRVAQAKRLDIKKDEAAPEDSWPLVSEELKKQVGYLVLSNQLEGQEGELRIESKDISDFVAYAESSIREHYVPERLAPYFGRPVLNFEIDEAAADKSHYDSPFERERLECALQFFTAVNDYEALESVLSGEKSARSISYQGREIPSGQLGDAARSQLDYIDSFTDKIREIDRDVFRYLYEREEDKEAVKKQYSILLHTEYTTDILKELMSRWEKFVKEYQREKNPQGERLQYYIGEVNKLENDYAELMENYPDSDLLDEFESDEFLGNLGFYISEHHNSETEINFAEANKLYTCIKGTHEVFEGIYLSKACSIPNDAMKYLPLKRSL